MILEEIKSNPLEFSSIVYKHESRFLNSKAHDVAVASENGSSGLAPPALLIIFVFPRTLLLSNKEPLLPKKAMPL
jgi:hypothetical protein